MSSNKHWTLEEDQYLEEYYGIKNIKLIAKKLGRSECAVINRKNRLELGKFLENGEYITFLTLLKCVYGIDKAENVYRYNNSKLWKTAPIKSKKVNNSSFRVIYIDDFWKWAEKNKEKLDFSKMEENILGVEPDWVKVKRKADAKSKRNTMKWTKAEDLKLKRLLAEQKYSYSDLEEIFNRHSGAIRKKIYDLSIETRPIRAKSKKWTDEEIIKLKKLKEDGFSETEIGKILGRTGQSVRGKLDHLAHPDMYLRVNRNKNR